MKGLFHVLRMNFQCSPCLLLSRSEVLRVLQSHNSYVPGKLCSTDQRVPANRCGQLVFVPTHTRGLSLYQRAGAMNVQA